MSNNYCVFEDLSDELYIHAFTKYLKKYHRETMLDIMSEMATDAFFAINVNVLELLQSSPKLGTLLISYPTKAIPLFNEAAKVAQDELKAEEGGELINRKEGVRIRLYSLPLCEETTKPSVSSIRSSDINKFVAVAGTVIKTGPIKMLEYKKTFQCSKCRGTFEVEADIEQHYILQKPITCTATENCSGKNFKPVESRHECRDYQEIKIQDKIAHLNVGSIPRSILVILEDDLVDVCKAGDDVIITGTVMRRWKPLKPDSRCTIEMIIHCNHIRINNEQKSNVNVTLELEEEFHNFWKRNSDTPLKARNLILKSLCPQLYGLYFVKLAVVLTLIGGVAMRKNGTRIRGESHLLLVGDPGTGKSQFLKYASRLSSRYVMTNGIGTTSAGLTVMATKESGGDWTLEAGALVLADGGVCCIDEFDSIREHDRATIHEAMEQQTLSIAKAGLVCKLNTRTTIFAACNPKGKYDATASLSINVALASPLLSRFDVVLVLLDQKNNEWDKAVSQFILDENQVEPDETDEQLWSIEKMQAYISYVKSKFKPTINEASGTILNRYYLAQRAKDQRVAARTTIRLLESLVRLAQAHARLMFREEVTELDAIMAVLTVDNSMHTSTLLDVSSVLHSNFPEEPDVLYEEQRKQVLRQLKLIPDELLTFRRTTQKSSTATQSKKKSDPIQQYLTIVDDDNDDEEPTSPPVKRSRLTSSNSYNDRGRQTTHIPSDDNNNVAKRSAVSKDGAEQRSENLNVNGNVMNQNIYNTTTSRAGNNMRLSNRTSSRPTLQKEVTNSPSSDHHSSIENKSNLNDNTSREKNSTTKPKKRSFAHVLMDTQPQENTEGEDEAMDTNEELSMLFGEIFEEGTGSQLDMPFSMIKNNRQRFMM
jgi:DNA helicase MCM9